MNLQDLTQTLVESFNALADEFQYLADKYAPAAPEISETLVKLQIPPELHNQTLANTNFVPLPRRNDPNSKHQIALIIREGRRVASSLTDFSKSSQSSRESRPPTTMTSLSTILEQDFTVEGKKGKLDCPFSQATSEVPDAENEDGERRHSNAPHDASDPICAAMNDESGSQPTASGAAKCPIRYMDHHSPEEIAHYFEMHKHELPRSHEVCVRRYQKNEDHIRKLDAKYGSLVSMVEGLTRIHQPMLPEQDTRPQSEVEKASNHRVENWAQTVSASLADDPDRTAPVPHGDDEERQSHFDRPLKEVRVGESPSRPWGISVPVFDTPSGRGEPDERPLSPPPAPVPMPLSSLPNPETPTKGVGKCPFDHAKMRQMADGATPIKQEDQRSMRLDDIPPTSNNNQPFGGGEQPPPLPGRASTPPQQPAFLNAADVAPLKPDGGTPQMLFTGPVFIGYPIEQAIQFMQHLQGPR
ncbi:hypothetical protein DL768_000268 [Monosporascus sp. mg162]|nr:hypothetical protein DL768_000268 [Monosporascus sp. mg162]